MSIFSRLFSRRSASVAPAPSDEVERPVQAQRTGIFNSAAAFFTRAFALPNGVYALEGEAMAAIAAARRGVDDNRGLATGVFQMTASSEGEQALPGQVSSISSEGLSSNR